MNLLKKISIVLFIVTSFIIFGVYDVGAATLNLTPEQINVSEGREFNIYLSVNSGESIINAVESTITYSTTSLELVGVDKNDSVIDVWVNPPSVSRSEGRIEFLGGTQKGIGGEFLNILIIRFKAIQEGSSDISFTDGNVAAADGEGTSILTDMFGSSVSIVSVEADAPQHTGLDPIPEVQDLPPEDDQVDDNEDDVDMKFRPPEKPQVSVPLFPNQSGWYSYRGPFNVFWGLPENVDKIGVAFNDNPRFELSEGMEDVCCGQRYIISEEGPLFVHVRFYNQYGSSPTYHHRINIDYTPPLAFDIDIIKGGINPEIEFETRDSVSGIKEYRVYVDDKDPIITEDTSIVLPDQSVGEHTVRVRAYDMADNFIEDVSSFSVSESTKAAGGFDKGMWIGFILAILGVAGWFIFRVYKS